MLRSSPLLLVLLAIILARPTFAAVPAEAQKLIQAAGNTEDEAQRRQALEQLAKLPGIEASLQQDAAALADFVRRWNEGGLKFYTAAFRGKPYPEYGKYDFGLSPASPLAPIASLYQGRMLAWMLIENSNVRTDAKWGPWFRDEAQRNFAVVAKEFPQNQVARMYLGEAIPWPLEFASPQNAPRWAVLQREQLERLRLIIHWWIDVRQREDGQFGGGWGDDCEMWRIWAPVLLGFHDPKITAAQLKFSKSALSRPHVKPGFNDKITDVEHAAEDTTDNLIPLMVLEPHQARWQNWALKLGDFMGKVWTADNNQGQRQFKSFYFSATETAPQPERAYDVLADVGALHPALLAWQQTGDEQLGALITDWLDTWVAATAREENGKPAGMLPASLAWPSGKAGGAAGNWWEPVKPGGYMHSYYIWPSVITELTDAMVIAYQMTGEDRYLNPLRSMAAARLAYLKNPPQQPLKPGSADWAASLLGPRKNANSNIAGLVKSLARYKALTGSTEFDELLAAEGGEFVIRTDAAGRADLVDALETSAATLRVNFPGFTSEVRSTDRMVRFIQFLAEDYQFDEYRGVEMPKHELLYRMVTGDKNAPRLPQLAVRWLTPPTDIAVLVTHANTSQLQAEMYHFGDQPRALTADLRLLSPGKYQPRLLQNGKPIGPALPPLEVKRGQANTVKIELPSQQLCVLDIQ